MQKMLSKLEGEKINKKDVQKLKHGLYRIYWKSGGCSLASVGSMPNGDRWIAPTNWVSCGTAELKYWKSILKVKALNLK